MIIQKFMLSGVEDLQRIRRIGSGVTGEVFQLKHRKTGTTMAAKVIFTHTHTYTHPSNRALNILKQVFIQAINTHTHAFTSLLSFSTHTHTLTQKMVWVDDAEERKRILMDLHVMSTHNSPYIVQYYGSVLVQVSSYTHTHTHTHTLTYPHTWSYIVHSSILRQEKGSF